MRKILNIIWGIIKDFLINPFWQSWRVLIILFFSLAFNGLLWYIYQTKIGENPIPFIFSSGLIILNLTLANYLFNRERLASFFLITTSLFVQILMLIFIRYLMIIF